VTVEQFVVNRGSGWRRLSELCDGLQRSGPRALGPGELREFDTLYRLAASDLAYATAHVPQLELLDYLNRLVARAHGLLFRHRRRPARTVGRFFRDYPAPWRAARTELCAATLLLLVPLLATWAAVLSEPKLATLFLPAEVTSQVIATDAGVIPLSAFAALSGMILTSNAVAALLCVAGGLLFGLGTAVSLLKNGLLIGALIGATQAASPASLLPLAGLLAPHGVLELTALVTCGAAGLKLGGALLRGGQLTRLAALRVAGREALVLLAGCLPWFVLAALIEGALTPLPAPPAVKLLFGLLLGGLLAAYLASGRPLPPNEPQGIMAGG